MRKSGEITVKPVVAFECGQCDELFRSEEELKSHEKQHHGASVEASDILVEDISVVDTASQTDFSQEFEDEIFLSENYTKLSDKVLDLEDLTYKQEFLLLKIRKIHELHQPQIESSRSTTPPEESPNEDTNEEISTQGSEEILIPFIEGGPPKSEMVNDVAVHKTNDDDSEKEAELKNLKLKIKFEKMGREAETSDENQCSDISKKTSRKERKRIKKLKKKLIREAERARLELEKTRMREAQQERAQESSKSTKRGRYDQGLERMEEKRRRIDFSSPEDDKTDTTKRDKKIAKKEKEWLNFETLEYKREKVKEMEAQREKLRLKLLEVMKKKSRDMMKNSQTSKDQEELGDRIADTPPPVLDEDDTDQENIIEPEGKVAFDEVEKSQESVAIKQKRIPSIFDIDFDLDTIPISVGEDRSSFCAEDDENNEDSTVGDSVVEDMVDRENASEKEDDFFEETIDSVVEDGIYQNLNLSGGSQEHTSMKIGDHDKAETDYVNYEHSSSLEQASATEKIRHQPDQFDHETVDHAHTSSATMTPIVDDLEMDNVDVPDGFKMAQEVEELSFPYYGYSSSQFDITDHSDHDQLIEEARFDKQVPTVSLHQQDPVFSEEDRNFEKPELNEEVNLHPLDPVLIEEEHHHQVDAPLSEKPLLQLQSRVSEEDHYHQEKHAPSVGAYHQQDHDLREEDHHHQKDAVLNEESLLNQRSRVLSEEADHGFFELLSDSDDDEDYLEFKLKTAVYFSTSHPPQSSGRVVTANFDEALSDSDESDHEEPLEAETLEDITRENITLDEEVMKVGTDIYISEDKGKDEPQMLCLNESPIPIETENLEGISEDKTNEETMNIGDNIKNSVNSKQEMKELAVADRSSSNDGIIYRDEGFESSPRRKQETTQIKRGTSWVNDVSLKRGWKIRRKGMKLLYKSRDGQLFQSRLEVFKHFIEDRRKNAKTSLK